LGGITTRPGAATANDALEHEADKVADQVMRMPNSALSTAVALPPRSHAGFNRAAAQTRDGGSSAPADTMDHGLRTSGRALDTATRVSFERRFGQDFSQARVHTDARGEASARSVGADAYTAGTHIVFAPGQYAPETRAGQYLLAHELAHVVQQGLWPAGTPVGLQKQSTGRGAQTLPTAAPGLGAKQTQDVDAMIKAGDFQGAVDMVVFYAGGGMGKNYSIDTSLLTDEKMTFDATVTWADATTAMPSWDFMNNKADPAKVKIGPSAFSSVSYLYSVIMHEYQHVLYQQSLSNQTKSKQASGHGGMDTEEVEASAWELLHANETGLDRLPDKVAVVWSALNAEFWQLDPAAQASARPLAQRAFREAQRMVARTNIKLDPFSHP